MKYKSKISISVPRLILQLFLSLLIGYFIYRGFIGPWIHHKHLSNFTKDILRILSFLVFLTPIFFLLVYRDITNKNKQYLQLLEQYGKFKVILEESPVGAFIYDESGYIFVNNKLCEIVGYSEAEIIGKKIHELPFINEETKENIIANVTRQKSKEKAREYYTLSVHHKNGEKLYLEVREKLSSLYGRAIILGSITDVTEKVALETSLKDNELMYRRLFEANMDSALMIDLQGKIMDVNLEGEKLSGYDREQLIGQHFSLIIAAEEFPRLQDMFQRIIEGNSLRYDTIGKKKNNELVYVIISAMPLYKEGKIFGFFAFIKDITEQKRHQETIQKLAYYDSLTKLPNRHFFIEKFETFIAEAEASQQRLALMFLDLDRMKMVNDNLGHTAGDELLKLASERFQKIIETRNVFLSRIGGDEFTVILPNVQSGEEVTKLAYDLINALSAPFYIEHNYIQLKTSIGIALYPEDGPDRKALMMAADTAMYKAKSSGGNQYNYYTRELQSESQKYFYFERDFSRAIENEEFYLVYQPKVDAEKQKICGVEALIRWNHPQKGLISPNDFITMAEVSGFIVPLGEWVLRKACFQVKQWQKTGLAPVRVAVNVSALHFQHEDFPEKIKAILQETELASKWLEIEITERTLMQENKVVISVMERLKEMGVWISLDDFGTGYSSLTYLKQYRLNSLKIDRAFIDQVDQHKERAEIVKAVIQLAHGLGMEVVAEGVETAEEFQFAQHHGVEEIQGYYISKPLPNQEIEKFLADYKN